ncbi:MAG TPA: hypothetical protein PLQ20_01205 [Candidatus Paceibacterota bacterium]|nr:hypothetical protein [Candidatus Paceibacterota bacterium]
MQPVTKQSFDFTVENNQQELEKWKEAVKEIPLPNKHYWQDGLPMDDEDRAETAFTATYEYLDVNEDTWFWLSVIFLCDGTSRLEFLASYSTPDEERLKPVVNRSLVMMGLQATDNIFSIPVVEMKTWQEGYDLLCSIARSRKIPKGRFESKN